MNALLALLMIVVLEDGTVHVGPSSLEECGDLARRTIAGQTATIESTDGRPSAIRVALCVPAEAVTVEPEDPESGGGR